MAVTKIFKQSRIQQIPLVLLFGLIQQQILQNDKGGEKINMGKSGVHKVMTLIIAGGPFPNLRKRAFRLLQLQIALIFVIGL